MPTKGQEQFDLGQRFSRRAMNREERRETTDIKNFLYVRLESCQADRSTRSFHLLHRQQKGPQSSTANKFQCRAIDD